MRNLLMVGAAVLVAGCSLQPEEGGSERVVGQILADSTFYPFLRTIVAPDSADADATIGITVNSFGSSSCTTPDGVGMVYGVFLVRITPYDRVPRGPVGCTADFATRPHPVDVALPPSGTFTIRAIGLTGTTLDSIDHVVHIRP